MEKVLNEIAKVNESNSMKFTVLMWAFGVVISLLGIIVTLKLFK